MFLSFSRGMPDDNYDFWLITFIALLLISFIGFVILAFRFFRQFKKNKGDEMKVKTDLGEN